LFISHIAIAAGELLGNFPMDQTLSQDFTMKPIPRLTAIIRLEGAYGIKGSKNKGANCNRPLFHCVFTI